MIFPYKNKKYSYSKDNDIIYLRKKESEFEYQVFENIQYVNTQQTANSRNAFKLSFDSSNSVLCHQQYPEKNLRQLLQLRPDDDKNHGKTNR